MELYIEKIVPRFYGTCGKGCAGCKRHQRDVMLSLMNQLDGNIYEVYLNTEQTEDIIKALQLELKRNSFKK